MLLRDGEVCDQTGPFMWADRLMEVVARRNRWLSEWLWAIWSAHTRTIPLLQQLPMHRGNFIVDFCRVNLASRVRYDSRVSEILM